MAPKTSSKPTKGSTKGSTKRSTKSQQPKPSSRSKPKSGAKPIPTQHKPKPNSAATQKKKPPHLRYTEKELKVPQLNGIRPVGVQKRVNAKKGKTFVDDKESMNAIMALVMAEKEGNIESKMMRARQMEEVREAKRLEAEKRAQSKKQGLEDRKDEIRQTQKKRRRPEGTAATGEQSDSGRSLKSSRKRVSFG